MVRINFHDQPEKCRALWQENFPETCFFDLWSTRSAFRDGFQRPSLFIEARYDGRCVGVLPLSWIDEENYFGYFPGETWSGKTWIEQNRIPASSPEVVEALLAAVPGPCRLRYLQDDSQLPANDLAADEINYSLQPRSYQDSSANYLETFNGKSRKKLLREVESLKRLGPDFRVNHFPDLDSMLNLNLAAYRENSYFHDSRFLTSFTNLAETLRRDQALRLVTVMIKDIIAAVDLIAVWRNHWTVLAGGTNPEFPGIAKLINLYHIEEACRRKIAHVDFLCGDFNWKERFHLAPQQLYKIDRRFPETDAGNGTKNLHD
ncbi:MAG: GNAT family N-acetyltransferase [Deltaproteobacteria bacterium]|nr:GNAT family N-acetyltransferase [Deltaproteobacteria bacterium]